MEGINGDVLVGSCWGYFSGFVLRRRAGGLMPLDRAVGVGRRSSNPHGSVRWRGSLEVDEMEGQP